MYKKLARKFLEATVSTLPISIAVIAISLFFKEITPPMYALFSFGSALLIIGLALFSIGIDLALIPLGQQVGTYVVNKQKIWLIILTPLACGTIIAIAEPGVTVLAHQIASGGPIASLIIYVLSAAVGLFLLISVLRIFLKLNLKYIFLIVYGILLTLAVITQIVNPDFVAVALDGGGVSTGAVTVPFLMSFTVGIATVAHRRGDAKGDEGFGTIALCTAGPAIVIMLVGLLSKINLSAPIFSFTEIFTFKDMLHAFGNGFLSSMKDVALSIAPVVAIFLVFQIFAFKLKKSKLQRMVIGLIFSYVGLTFFLTGVNIGFMPIGKLLAGTIASSKYKWLLIPIGSLLGALIVLAEPSVHALTKQVNELSSGILSRKILLLLLCIGVSLAVSLSLLRVLTGISILWMLIPIYVVCLILTFFAPKLFTAVAFDSGGVASGPMTATFALPFVIGACSALGGNIFTDAFGIVASITMAPILIIMIAGVMYQLKVRKAELASELEALPMPQDVILLTEDTSDGQELPAKSSIILDYEDVLDYDIDDENGDVTNENFIDIANSLVVEKENEDISDEAQKSLDIEEESKEISTEVKNSLGVEEENKGISAEAQKNLGIEEENKGISAELKNSLGIEKENEDISAELKNSLGIEEENKDISADEKILGIEEKDKSKDDK